MRMLLVMFVGIVLYLGASVAFAQQRPSIILTWVNPTTATDGSPDTALWIRVYRAENGNPFTVYATIAAAPATFIDMRVPRGTTMYRVTALDSAGVESGQSNTVSVECRQKRCR